jgi:hypothetical protein
MLKIHAPFRFELLGRVHKGTTRCTAALLRMADGHKTLGGRPGDSFFVFYFPPLWVRIARNVKKGS